MYHKFADLLRKAGDKTRQGAKMAVFAAGAATFGVVGLSAAEGEAEARNKDGHGGDDRPNVVMIVADDMGYSDIGAFGSEISTPNLDALASRGMVFDNFRTGPTCSPSRSMFLTGADNHLAGMGTMSYAIAETQKGQPGYESYLSDRVVTFAQLLSDSGYHTYMAGKWHLGEHSPDQFPSAKGFDRTFTLLSGAAFHFTQDGWTPNKPDAPYAIDGEEIERGDPRFPNDFYSTRTYTDKMIEFIKSNEDDDKPFFAYLAYTAPHAPLQAPKDYIDKHLEAGLYEKGWDELRQERFDRMKAMGLIPANIEIPERWGHVEAWDSLSMAEKEKEVKRMAIYAAMIDYLDDSVGRFIDELKALDEYDNTIFVFFSDNGADGELADKDGNPAFREWWESIGIDYTDMEALGSAKSFITYIAGWAQVSTTPHWGSKKSQADGGIRGPFFITYPGKVKAGRTSSFASVLDIAPTILEYTGVEHPGTSYKGRTIVPMSGRSMHNLLAGNMDYLYAPDEPVSFEIFGTMNRAVFMGDWKALRLGDAPWGGSLREDQTDMPWKLFNIAEDPTEQEDISDMYPQQLQMMVDAYKDYEEDVGIIYAPGFDPH
ncbi:MAG: arylsulfatase [Prochlorothrix sp.]|nr:arylsulfatase [Prochlorothrix sp.]